MQHMVSPLDKYRFKLLEAQRELQQLLSTMDRTTKQNARLTHLIARVKSLQKEISLIQRHIELGEED